MKKIYIVPKTEKWEVSLEACFVISSFPAGSGSTGGTESMDVDDDEVSW